jgi:hypothetical protein
MPAWDVLAFFMLRTGNGLVAATAFVGGLHGRRDARRAAGGAAIGVPDGLRAVRPAARQQVRNAGSCSWRPSGGPLAALWSAVLPLSVCWERSAPHGGRLVD